MSDSITLRVCITLILIVSLNEAQSGELWSQLLEISSVLKFLSKMKIFSSPCIREIHLSVLYPVNFQVLLGFCPKYFLTGHSVLQCPTHSSHVRRNDLSKMLTTVTPPA